MYPPSNGHGTLHGAGRSAYAEQQSNTSAPPPRPVIQQGLDVQEQALGRLHTTISDLESRLSLVLENTPTPQDGNAAISKDVPQILDRVHRHAGGIDAASSRIDRLIARLQL